jgi:hypothetical protein
MNVEWIGTFFALFAQPFAFFAVKINRKGRKEDAMGARSQG